MTLKPPTDWEAIEREYRAGQLSIRQIAAAHDVSDTAIRKRAKLDGWTRPLADKVRDAVREALVRTDGSHAGSHPPRASDRDVVEAAASRGVELVHSHRKDIIQLRALAKILAERLSQHLDGVTVIGIGERESASDVLAKLTQTTARLIPLERQANGLDATATGDRDNGADDDGGALERLATRMARERGTGVAREAVPA